MNELRKCPFCGCDLNDYTPLMIIQKRKINTDLVTVQCPHCSAMRPAGWSELDAKDKWNGGKTKCQNLKDNANSVG